MGKKGNLGHGAGHYYMVQVLRYFSGNLEDCIKFMNEHPPLSQYQWYELDPIVHLKDGSCIEYKCSLVKLYAVD